MSATAMHPYRGSYMLPAFEQATVADVMRHGVMSCSPDATLVSVAQTMATNHIHAAVVAGIAPDREHGPQLVWAILSDIDIVHAAAAGALEATARDAARTEAATVEATMSLTDAARLMDRHRVTHLVVVEGTRPTGIISTLDLIGAIAWGRA
jgi:predicted transcriptional regulator